MDSHEDIIVAMLWVGFMVYMGKLIMKYVEKNPKFSDKFKKTAKKFFMVYCILCLIAIFTLRFMSRRIGY